MRVAILSDIHGNQTALEAVLQDLAQQPAIDQLVIAGDLCLNGPRPREVLAMIRQLHCPVIKGNVDRDVAEGSKEKGPKKQSVISWTREQVGPEGIEYMANLPFSHLISNARGNDLLIVHANPRDLDEAIFPTTPESKLEYLFRDVSSTVGAVAFGHYHVAYQRRWGHLLLADVGSVGLPRDGDQRASYGILTHWDGVWQIEHRRVPYAIETTIEHLRTCGIPMVEKRIKVLTEAHY